MENLHGNMHVFVLSCFTFTCKHKYMHVFMYFQYLLLPPYIIMVKGLLIELGLGLGFWDRDGIGSCC